MDNQYRLNRDARRVIALLSQLYRDKMSCELQYSVADGYMIDTLMIRFYAPPIINMLTSKIKGVRNLQDKHFTFDYWVPMIVNMLKTNPSAKRANAVTPDWDENPITQIPIMRFEYITGAYLLTDYGYDETVMLHRIVNTYDDDEIRYACRIGIQNKVYDIRYINVILEKERAKRMIDIQKIQSMDTTVRAQSDMLLNEEIHEHSVLDMAQVQYSWENARQNAELERMFNNLTKGMRK